MSSLLFWRRTLKVGHLTPYNVHKWMRSSKLLPSTRLSKLNKMFQMEAKFKKKTFCRKKLHFPREELLKKSRNLFKNYTKTWWFFKNFFQFVFYTVKVYLNGLLGGGCQRYLHTDLQRSGLTFYEDNTVRLKDKFGYITVSLKCHLRKNAFCS